MPPSAAALISGSLANLKSTTAGLCLILLTGCQSVPEEKTQDAANQTLTQILPPATSTYTRVGVEYLPPETQRRRATGSWIDPQGAESTQPSLVVVDDPLFSNPPRSGRQPISVAPEVQERWALERAQIRAKRNVIERVALRFLSELIGDDRKRVQRAIGAPLLHAELRLSDDPMSNFLDERDREDHQRLLTKNVSRMIRRPARNAAKELPLFNNVESAIQSFKDANRKYQDKKKLGLGRISMRLRANSNPVELVWIRGGLRIASNMEHGKASFSTSLTEDLKISLRTKFSYDNHDWRLFGSLEYDLNDYSTFYVLAGNEVNILGGPVSFPGGPQSEETSKGILLYFEHQF